MGDPYISIIMRRVLSKYNCGMFLISRKFGPEFPKICPARFAIMPVSFTNRSIWLKVLPHNFKKLMDFNLKKKS